jgi:hypothetical protein
MTARLELLVASHQKVLGEARRRDGEEWLLSGGVHDLMHLERLETLEARLR